MRILILNWRCPLNPHSGGAEALTHEVARRWVAQGDEVEWFSASFRGALSAQVLDGIRIVRAGRQSTVHWHAFRRYFGRLGDRFDAVVDEVNTIPFFTPLWAGIPTRLLIFQLAREVWWYESKFPLSAIGYLLEPFYLRCYRKVPVITISRSTETDLRRLGFRGSVAIVPPGNSAIDIPRVQRQDNATFVYVGRISPSKRLAHIVKALSIFRARHGGGRLWLIGEGSPAYVRNLSRLCARLGLTEHVEFLGQLPKVEKQRRMAEAHALLMTSVREGWGMVVTEANASGTPAVAYDVPGLRDSVRDELTGLLVDPSPSHLAEGMLRLINDAGLFARLSDGARSWSRRLSYDAAAISMRAAIMNGLEAVSPYDQAMPPDKSELTSGSRQ